MPYGDIYYFGAMATKIEVSVLLPVVRRVDRVEGVAQVGQVPPLVVHPHQRELLGDLVRHCRGRGTWLIIASSLLATAGAGAGNGAGGARPFPTSTVGSIGEALD